MIAQISNAIPEIQPTGVVQIYWWEIVKAVGGGAVVLGFVGWLIRELVTHSFKKDADRALANLQASADLQLENFKSNANLQLESFKASLREANSGA